MVIIIKNIFIHTVVKLDIKIDQITALAQVNLKFLLDLIIFNEINIDKQIF